MICRMFAGSTILAVAIIAAWPTFAAEGIPKKLFNGSTLEGWSGDPSHWSVVGLVSDNHRESRSYRDKVFTPSEQSWHFTFNYDPAANNGIGRITYTLDGEQFTVDLIPEQRESGAIFDRFGLANVRSGGNSIEFYLDDVNYTARRDLSKKRQRRKQEIMEVDYPHEHGGRKY